MSVSNRVFSASLLDSTYKDNGLAGWYQTSDVSSISNNVVLRVGNIPASLATNAYTGMIYYSDVDGVFRGYSSNVNGSHTHGWVNFNSATGPTGPTGHNFESQVNFHNTENDKSVSAIQSAGSIFKTTEFVPSGNTTDIYIRTIEGGTANQNGDTIKLLDIYQSNTVITLNTHTFPHTWDFTNNNGIISVLSGAYESDYASDELKCYGEKSSWTVYADVKAGQAVKLVRDDTKLKIAPVTYNGSQGLTFASCPIMLGIALSNTTATNNCNVCIRGITTVTCNTVVGSYDVANSTVTVGAVGFVGPSGYIFRPSQLPTSQQHVQYDYIRAGYFVADSSVATDGNKLLFNVDIKHSAF